MVQALVVVDPDSSLPLGGEKSILVGGVGSSRVKIQTSSRPRMVEIVRLNFDSVWQFARRLGVRANDIEDAVQQVFLVGAERLDDIEEGRERAFLFGVTIHVVHRLRHTMATRPLVVGEAPEAVDPSPNPEELAHQKSERERVERILEAMPLKLREVFVLYELERLSVREAAEVLQIAEGTAASRLSRARDEFRRMVRREEACRRVTPGTHEDR